MVWTKIMDFWLWRDMAVEKIANFGVAGLVFAIVGGLFVLFLVSKALKVSNAIMGKAAGWLLLVGSWCAKGLLFAILARQLERLLVNSDMIDALFDKHVWAGLVRDISVAIDNVSETELADGKKWWRPF
jgi:hypothetical protein